MHEVVQINKNTWRIEDGHGSFPVHPSLIGKLIEGASDIVQGRASAVPMSLFGQEVSLYKFEFAGFLCDPESE